MCSPPLNPAAKGWGTERQTQALRNSFNNVELKVLRNCGGSD